MKYSVAEIRNIIGNNSIIQNNHLLITEIGYDSRRISDGENILFFCLSGESRSGAQFIGDAYQRGVRNFVCSKIEGPEKFENSNFFICEDPLEALQKFAAAHRIKYRIPVIGITGSNGKTIVKEWLYHLLQNDFHIVRSPRSFNSQLGVSLSVLGIEKEDSLGIFEAGISRTGEMEKLQKIIRPDLGIFTHLGSAHDANFENLADKTAEKMKLFSESDVIVYPADIEEISKAAGILKAGNPLLKTISWGYSEHAGMQITRVSYSGVFTTIEFRSRAATHQICIPFSDNASIANAMTCICTLSALERWDEEHIELFKHLPVLENRLSFFEGKNGNYIVNDSYSNDTDSLQVALDFFQRQQPGKPHLLILSDLVQSHSDKKVLYHKVAQILKQNKIQDFIGIGPELMQNKTAFSDFNSTFFENTGAFFESGTGDKIHDKSILIKGSRKFRFEDIVSNLRKQMHQTFLEIDLNALRNNFNHFRNRCIPGTKIMAMVKAFGYGSGSFEAARTLQFMGTDYLAVAFTDEGVALRKAGIQIPVMVMNCSAEDASVLYEYNLEPVIFNANGIREFAATGFGFNVHLECDTGMHRLGFNEDEIEEVCKNFPVELKVRSVFSHLSASEDPEHDDFTKLQINRFTFVYTNIEKWLGYGVIKHIANSGAILRFPHAHLDMVRLGIGLYGVDPRGGISEELEVVTTLKTHISQLRNIRAGESVGYSRKAIDHSERKIATIPVGYADGLRRKLGNGTGSVFINGKYAPIIGNICMDMCMCDVTDIDCKEGDIVEIFGKNIRVETVAEQCETIPYEILTAVSQRVRREYIGEN